MSSVPTSPFQPWTRSNAAIYESGVQPFDGRYFSSPSDAYAHFTEYPFPAVQSSKAEEALSGHYRKAQILQHGAYLRPHLQQKHTDWFINYLNTSIRPIYGPVKVLGFIGPGSLQDAYWSGEAIHSEWTQFWLNRWRFESWKQYLEVPSTLGDHNSATAGQVKRIEHFAFACESSFSYDKQDHHQPASNEQGEKTASEVVIYRKAGIAAFPWYFSPNTNIPWPNHTGGIHPIFSDAGCPESIRKAGMLGVLTCLDVTGLFYGEKIKIIAWAIGKDLLRNLILLDDGMDRRSEEKDSTVYWALKHAMISNPFGAALGQKEQDHLHSIGNNFVEGRLANLQIYWWPPSSMKRLGQPLAELRQRAELKEKWLEQARMKKGSPDNKMPLDVFPSALHHHHH